MSLAAADLLVDVVQSYLAVGVVFAAIFVSRWVGRVDQLAEQGTLGFRVLIVPGVAALWPLFAVRVIRHVSAPPDEWTAHRARSRRSSETSPQGRR